MDPEDKKDDSKEFGRVIDALHSKQKLPSLRTYQGDMAEFIKEKNESVISVAVKEKMAKEKEKEDKKYDFSSNLLNNKQIPKGDGFQINLTILFSSLVLIIGGVIASLYVFDFVKKGPVDKVVIKEEIIPYNNLITLANLNGKNLGVELSKLTPTNGVSVLKMSDQNGNLFQTTKELFDFLEISLPATLERTLGDEYVFGIISKNNQTSIFIIIKVNDFGRAFSAMLDWEKSMENDLSFLESRSQIAPAPDGDYQNFASGTASTTLTKIPIKPKVFIWKDVIVKNKDTRALVNDKNESKIAYSFLDKNTILITDNLSIIGDISSAYTSRSVAR